MKRKVRTFSGSLSPEVTEREVKNRRLARKAATECMVLLQNKGVLPLQEKAKVCLYGNGAAHMIKGGTGSGDVNEREVVTILRGLLGAGLEVLNAKEVAASEEAYNAARLAWRDLIFDEMTKAEHGSGMGFFQIYANHPFHAPAGVDLDEGQICEADAVIYMISRVAGEGADRFDQAGDYYLTAEETADLKALAGLTDKVVVMINTGGQIDVKELTANPAVNAIIYMSQLGMETGNAVADLLTGKVNPSGRLTSTWAINYEDFPNAKTFSHNNGDVMNERYEEGIYVGYRYFDSFGVKTQYPFGYGLSYTDFEVKPLAVTADPKEICISVSVANTGSLAGKEVVQVYAACPQNNLKKEHKRLIGFAKTKTLAPGESQTVTITAIPKALASFDEKAGAWILSEGEYAIFAGKDAEHIELAGVLSAASSVVIEKVPHVLPLQEALTEIERPDQPADAFTAAWKAEASAKGMEAIAFAPEAEGYQVPQKGELDTIAEDIVSKLTDREMTLMLLGEITKGQDSVKDGQLVTTGIYVPGAAGETSGVLEEKYDVPAISMADGPAGLRLVRSYEVDRESGLIYGQGLMSALEGGLFANTKKHENADTYYMYATAIPVGTALAQTWNPALLEEVGAMVGGEMVEFGVAWWLAPGMNIHRNPLCGRNFEYYSEDPLLAGNMAAAMTKGVQSVSGVGTTIKHFAFNNQEDNRMGSNSIVSERAAREIYLKGFEIAIKDSQPMCIMTSYNLVNGVHAANNYDLCTELARKEWGFEGIIMTDWTTTWPGNGSIPHACALAGNDLIMPGCQYDVDEILAALESGELPREAARENVARMIKVLLQTIGMEQSE